MVIKETCNCGAMFYVDGSDMGVLASMQEEFHTQHADCTKAPNPTLTTYNELPPSDGINPLYKISSARQDNTKGVE